jgi:hypothetical protein
MATYIHRVYVHEFVGSYVDITMIWILHVSPRLAQESNFLQEAF